MADMFKDYVFPKYEKRRVMRSQMEGFGDPALKSFSLLDSSALMKVELKDGMFEDEFISSFLNAAKVLAAAGREAIDRPGMYVMYYHSYAIPVLFLTRHCMELAIKRAIRKYGREPKRTTAFRGSGARFSRSSQGRGGVRTEGSSRTWVHSSGPLPTSTTTASASDTRGTRRAS